MCFKETGDKPKLVVCPQPDFWNDIYLRLKNYWESDLRKMGPKPPIPLILGAWWDSLNFEKKERWDETLDWIKENSCSHLITDLSEEKMYSVSEHEFWNE